MKKYLPDCFTLVFSVVIALLSGMLASAFDINYFIMLLPTVAFIILVIVLKDKYRDRRE